MAGLYLKMRYWRMSSRTNTLLVAPSKSQKKYAVQVSRTTLHMHRKRQIQIRINGRDWSRNSKRNVLTTIRCPLMKALLPARPSTRLAFGKILLRHKCTFVQRWDPDLQLILARLFLRGHVELSHESWWIAEQFPVILWHKQHYKRIFVLHFL